MENPRLKNHVEVFPLTKRGQVYKSYQLVALERLH
jgi:hypothetical protein